MFAINRILCPVDFSDASQAALPIAFGLARDRGASVVLLYVRPAPMLVSGEFGPIVAEPLGPVEPLQARLRELVPAGHKGTVDCHIADGDAAQEILEEATRLSCDLIVMGTHGRSGLGRLLIGSVTEEVLRRSPCPVLTIRPAMSQTATSATAQAASPKVDANELMTICTAATAVEADIVRNALNAEGIRCFSDGMTQAGLAGNLGVPVKVNVRAADYSRASKLLQHH